MHTLETKIMMTTRRRFIVVNCYENGATTAYIRDAEFSLSLIVYT